jgi:hypothetical protein
VRPEGLEPPAYWFEASRSIQLSYRRTSIEPLTASVSHDRFGSASPFPRVNSRHSRYNPPASYSSGTYAQFAPREWLSTCCSPSCLKAR